MNVQMQPLQTIGVQLQFKTSKMTAAGVYRGQLQIASGNMIVKTIPYCITVWPFALEDKPLTTAIFDNRFWKGPEHKDYKQVDLAAFLRKNMLSFDEIPAKPQFKLVDGKVTADFTEFDKLAARWFDEWDIPLAYLPIFREHFGWGRPPKNFLGVKPYPGEWPFEGVDRGKFTPEYKRVCQDALKLMMSHLREKGWEDRFLLYVADEPHERTAGIKEQMIALCDMFHEAWPTVKIYSSTWRYVPEWLGKLDVWGIGVQGQVTPEQFKIMKDAGAEFLITTDGQMCVDTPYNAIERLLPLYAWKHGLLGYEYWGADWYTLNPVQWGIHTVHFESDRPGHVFRVRYPNADGYVVYLYNKSAKQWQRYAKTTGGNNVQLVNKLNSGEAYALTARAYKTVNGTEVLSPSFNNYKTSTNPAKVSFSVTSKSKGAATYTWSKVTGATSYALYYKATSGAAWTRVATVNNSTTSFTKTGLKSGTGYFTVRAVRTYEGKAYGSAFDTRTAKVK